jgi:carbon-monoxide dehydrogenase large subunit
MSILGNRVLRREDPAMLTEGGTYVDDIELPGAGFVTFVRSTMAHARILGIDLDEARQAPGVIDIVTAVEVDEAGLADLPPASPMMNGAMTRPLLARDTVRFVGEPIAAIVTEHHDQGTDAAELVIVDYDPLDAVVDPESALADGSVLLHEGAGSHNALEIDGRAMNVDFSECEVVVTQRMTNQRVAPSPIEGRVSAARWTDEGRLEQWVSCQGAHPVRDVLAEGLPPADDRRRAGKLTPEREAALLALAAR